MKNFFILVSVLAFISCSGNNATKNDKFEYPGLGVLVESYYRAYYDYPKTINDLISFINARNFPENFNTTIEKIKDNRDVIILNNEKNILRIRIEDNIIYETALRSPCDELSYNVGFYLGRVLFFDAKGLSITSEEIESQFKIGLKEIISQFQKIKKKDDVNEYVMLAYSRLEGIVLLCDQDVSMEDYKFFQEIGIYLDEFLEKYCLNKIVFTTAIFIN